jgi:hypothetical protein
MRLSPALLALAMLAGCSPSTEPPAAAEADEPPAQAVATVPAPAARAAIADVDWAAFQASAPQALKDSLAEADGVCRSDGGRIEVGAKGVQSADINADGEPDYFVDYSGGVGCAGAESAQSAFCGAAGRCAFDVFVSQGGGYVRQDLLLQGPELRQAEGRIEIVDGGGQVLGWTGSKVEVIPVR